MTQLKDEYTEIKVELKLDEQGLVIAPRDDIALTMLQQILDQAPKSLVLMSGGMACENGRDITGAYLNCGGEPYQHSVTTSGGSRRITTEYHDAIKVLLDLTKEDDAAIGRLRSYFWYGMRLDPSSTVDSFRILPAVYCEVCSKEITNVSEMEWGTCDACASVCDHVYQEMVGVYRGNSAWLPCCTKCGRGDPNWVPNEDPAVDALNTVTQGGLDAMVLEHPDGTTSYITKQ